MKWILFSELNHKQFRCEDVFCFMSSVTTLVARWHLQVGVKLEILLLNQTQEAGDTRAKRTGREMLYSDLLRIWKLTYKQVTKDPTEVSHHCGVCLEPECTDIRYLSLSKTKIFFIFLILIKQLNSEHLVKCSLYKWLRIGNYSED